MYKTCQVDVLTFEPRRAAVGKIHQTDPLAVRDGRGERRAIAFIVHAGIFLAGGRLCAVFGSKIIGPTFAGEHSARMLAVI